MVADPDLTNAVQGATLLIFVLPHQVMWMPPFSRATQGAQPTCAAAPPPAAVDRRSVLQTSWQFLGRICPQMTGMAKGCRAVSLIKVRPDPRLHRTVLHESGSMESSLLDPNCVCDI